MSAAQKCPINGIKMAEFDMSDFVWPNKVSECTWNEKRTTAKNNPHSEKPFDPTPKQIYPDILSVIGSTPLVRLNNIPKKEGIKCEIYVKCEFLNPGGSVKDRIGYRMVLDAEEKKLLIPGCTIIEPTSGNTGIGIAMACAVKGYKCLIVMPEKMSDEKQNTLKALGATIIRTPTEAAFDSPDSLIAVAQRLKKEIPNSVILDQYRNAGNPLAHYDGTGAEILWQCKDVTAVILGAGTGGTVTGIGRKIKEKRPQCKIVSVDPHGSSLARPEKLNETDVTFYDVEGIGYDFVPTVLDHGVVDEWIKVGDHEAFTMARRLQSEEGILCGGSSGTAVHAAVEYARGLDASEKLVVILPDSVRNYMSKFIIDSWLEARNHKESINIHNYPWWDKTVASLNLPKLDTVKTDEKCVDVIKKLKVLNQEQIPIVDGASGEIKGVATRAHTLNRLLNDNMDSTSQIINFIYKQFRKLTEETSLGRISRILEKEPFVVIIEKKDDGTKTLEIPVGVITKEFFLDYVISYGSDKSQNGH